VELNNKDLEYGKQITELLANNTSLTNVAETIGVSYKVLCRNKNTWLYAYELSLLREKNKDLIEIATEVETLRKENELLTEQANVIPSLTEQLEQHLKPKYWLQKVSYILLGIGAFESYNGYILYLNMISKDIPELIAIPYAIFFAITSITVLIFRHNWGIIFCLIAAFFNGLIHVGIDNIDMENLFYIILTVSSVGIFSQIYNKLNN
jgi:hypothetical protein